MLIFFCFFLLTDVYDALDALDGSAQRFDVALVGGRVLSVSLLHQ